jgi:hypothetical protein
LRLSTVIALAIGVASITATILLSQWLVAQDSLLIWAIGATMFFVAGFVLGFLTTRSTWLSPLFVICGVAIGILGEALLAEYFRHQTRNLWPIDIVIWSLIAIGPIYLGFAASRQIAMSRARS